MDGKGKRNKGQRGEREAATLLSDQLGFIVERNLDQTRNGGSDLTIGKWQIEVKRHERGTAAIDKWFQQSIESCTPFSGERPAVMFRKSNQAWKVCISLKDFIYLVRETFDE